MEPVQRLLETSWELATSRRDEASVEQASERMATAIVKDNRPAGAESPASITAIIRTAFPVPGEHGSELFMPPSYGAKREPVMPSVSLMPKHMLRPDAVEPTETDSVKSLLGDSISLRSALTPSFVSLIGAPALEEIVLGSDDEEEEEEYYECVDAKQLH